MLIHKIHKRTVAHAAVLFLPPPGSFLRIQGWFFKFRSSGLSPPKFSLCTGLVFGLKFRGNTSQQMRLPILPGRQGVSITLRNQCPKFSHAVLGGWVGSEQTCKGFTDHGADDKHVTLRWTTALHGDTLAYRIEFL